MSTAFVFGPNTEHYALAPSHPFKAVRARVVKSLLECAGLLPVANVVAPNPATLEELLRVHSRGFVERVVQASRGNPSPDHADYGIGTTDTPIFANMHEATLAVVGGTLTAARLVVSGQFKQAVHLAGGLHHAQRDKAAGFCVYNDLSVAIAELRAAGLRVAYLDIDAHHGDGVQWLHYEDPNVLTISVHETGRYLFPGTGFTYELGRGAGLGYSLNVPLEPFTQDDGFLEVLERVLQPALAWFRPDVIVLQGGADAHAFDPLADLKITTQGFVRVFELVSQLANVYTAGRIVATGGGGYATWTAVPRVWSALYARLAGLALPQVVPPVWLAQWKAESEVEILPPAFWDNPDDVPRRATIDATNAASAKQLLEGWRQVI